MRDESWVFYVNKHEQLGFAPDSDPLEVGGRRINTCKVMATLFWNTSGLHVSNCLAGKSFDADSFVRHVLTPINHLLIVDVSYLISLCLPSFCFENINLSPLTTSLTSKLIVPFNSICRFKASKILHKIRRM
jgi:hypothetical protein